MKKLLAVIIAVMLCAAACAPKEPAMDPVCDAAADAPSCVRPDFSSRIGFPVSAITSSAAPPKQLGQ